MRKFGLFAAFMAMSLLAGCGQSDDPAKGNASKDKAGTDRVADNAVPGADGAAPSCPPELSKASGPDIVGIHLGISGAEAFAIAQCHAPSAKVKPEDSWLQLEAHGIKLKQQLVRLTAGVAHVCRQGDVQCMLSGKEWDQIDEEITIASPGVPGHEAVAGVWRTQNFVEGSQPVVNDMIAALIKKYGQPQSQRNYSPPEYPAPGRMEIYWQTDPSGAPMSEQNPNYNRCVGSVRPDGETTQQWSDGCGMSISASIDRSRTNPDLAASLKVGIMDQAKTYAYGEAIQQQLNQMDGARRQEELNKAKQSGSNVQL